MKIRDIQIPVRVNADEMKKFRKYAESQHLGLSALIRKMLHTAVENQAKERAA